MRALNLLRPRRRYEIKNWYKWVLGYFRRRLQRKLDNVVVMDGDRGFGKSTTCQRLGYDLDPMWRANPRLAARYFIIFSAREFVTLMGALFYASDSSQLEFYRGRWLVEEETGAGGSYLATAPAQEKRNIMEVMRKWQINYIMNLPVRTRIETFTYEFASAIFWAKNIDHDRRVVYGKVRVRYREEGKIAFLHPWYYVLLRKGIYPPTMIPFFASKPGGFFVASWAPQEIWEAYEEEKDTWFRHYILTSFRRIKRLLKGSSDIGTYIARQHFVAMERAFDLFEENMDKLMRIAEKRRADVGDESFVDVVHDAISDSSDVSEKDMRAIKVLKTKKKYQT